MSTKTLFLAHCGGVTSSSVTSHYIGWWEVKTVIFSVVYFLNDRNGNENKKDKENDNENGNKTTKYIHVISSLLKVGVYQCYVISLP